MANKIHMGVPVEEPTHTACGRWLEYQPRPGLASTLNGVNCEKCRRSLAFQWRTRESRKLAFQQLIREQEAVNGLL